MFTGRNAYTIALDIEKLQYPGILRVKDVGFVSLMAKFENVSGVTFLNEKGDVCSFRIENKAAKMQALRALDGDTLARFEPKN